MNRGPAALALLTALTACGASSSPHGAAPAYATSSGAAPSTTGEARATLRSPEALAAQQPTPVMEFPAAIQAAPLTVAPVTTPSNPRPAPPPDAAQGGGDAVSAQEEVVRRNEAALAAALAECRTVCTAAGNICVAAGEICRLTSDRDPRCERARARCADAGRRRDGTCPACPSPR